MISLESKTRLTLALFVSGFASASIGCAEADDYSTEEIETESVSQPIINGQPANSYTEAALINMPGYICSGSIIAPRVALTAGHCVTGNSFTVVAPYANQSATGTKKWTEYIQTGQYVNPNRNDVAVIILDKPIQLPWYPPLASSPVAVGTKAVNVGRIRNNQASNSGLFYGKEVTLRGGSSYGFPFSYVSEEVIQSGDSGGPVYVGSGSNRTIVAVNSGGGGGTQILARVDLAYTKIQQLIAENGGPGSSTPSPSNPTCSRNESEPNDSWQEANPLSSTICGNLSTSSDVDWFSWSVGSAGVSYDIRLTTSGDADILMWKNENGTWHRITNTSPTQFKATSTGAGNYVIAVRSAGGSTQSYSLSLAK